MYTPAQLQTLDKKVAARIRIEQAICRKLVQAALDAGWSVSVNDGGAWTLSNSTKASDIYAAMMTTDEDMIAFHDAQRAFKGQVYLVYGNDGFDVMADSSSMLDEFLKPIEAYAETFDK